MTREELIKLRGKYLKTSASYARKAAEVTKQLSVGCIHESTCKLQRDADDGYGSWWKIDVEMCNFCSAEKVYGTWHKREELS